MIEEVSFSSGQKKMATTISNIKLFLNINQMVVRKTRYAATSRICTSQFWIVLLGSKTPQQRK